MSLRGFVLKSMNTLPDCNAGRISFISTSYGNQELTYEFLHNWLLQLYRSYQLNPELLFVNEKVQRDLHLMLCRLLEQQPLRFDMAMDALRVSRFTNPITGRQMSIAILPTLPDGMMLVGDLVLGVPDQIYVFEEKEKG